MSQSKGLCVIGAGAIAERHMQAISRIEGVVPRWVVSRPEPGAHDFARRWQCAQAGSSVDEALADPLVALALITAPAPRVRARLRRSHPARGMALDVGLQTVPAGGELIIQARDYNQEQPAGRMQFISHEDVLTG